MSDDSTPSGERSVFDPAGPNDAGPADAAAAGQEGPKGSLPSPEVVVKTADLSALRDKAAEADTFKDRYLRSVAELENYRRRAARERQEERQYANQALLEKLLPALDNLDMALSAMSSPQGAGLDSLKMGVEMVLGQLKGVLRDAGLEEVDAVGQPFDPAWHEAVSQRETAEVPEGSVVQQLRKGYRLQQRLLRPASVVVARAPHG